MIIQLLKKTVQKLYVIKQWFGRASQNITFVMLNGFCPSHSYT